MERGEGIIIPNKEGKIKTEKVTRAHKLMFWRGMREDNVAE